MLFLHETHDVAAGRMAEFEQAFQTVWRPLVERDRGARVLWFWELTHGTGASYQAISFTAVRDWAAWGAHAERERTDPALRAWHELVGPLRRDVTAKLVVPTQWSPLQAVDLDTPEPSPTATAPGIYLHDTGWPYPGGLHAYADALGAVYYPQILQTRMISITGCFTIAPGTGRHHEAILLQRVEDWDRFTQLLSHGETGAQRGGWMVEGLKYRDRWESKLLRCARWSPRQ